MFQVINGLAILLPRVLEAGTCRHREKRNWCCHALAKLCGAEPPMAVKHKVLRKSHNIPHLASSTQGRTQSFSQEATKSAQEKQKKRKCNVVRKR